MPSKGTERGTSRSALATCVRVAVKLDPLAGEPEHGLAP